MTLGAKSNVYHLKHYKCRKFNTQRERTYELYKMYRFRRSVCRVFYHTRVQGTIVCMSKSLVFIQVSTRFDIPQGTTGPVIIFHFRSMSNVDLIIVRDKYYVGMKLYRVYKNFFLNYRLIKMFFRPTD